MPSSPTTELLEPTIRLRVQLVLVICGTLFPATAWAQDSHYGPKNQLIPTPDCLTLKGLSLGSSTNLCGPDVHREWLNDITHWRMERRIRIGYDGWRYEQPALAWTQSSFMQPQMMVHDRYFYDPVAGKYTV